MTRGRSSLDVGGKGSRVVSGTRSLLGLNIALRRGVRCRGAVVKTGDRVLLLSGEVGTCMSSVGLVLATVGVGSRRLLGSAGELFSLSVIIRGTGERGYGV